LKDLQQGTGPRAWIRKTKASLGGRVRQKQNEQQENTNMKRNIRLKGDALTRIAKFYADHPVAIPRAVALFTEAASLNTALQTHAGSQILGRGGYRGGATERKILATEIRTVLADMAATARGLEREHPGMTDQFRMGRAANSHAQLVATATAFLAASAPAEVKQLFTERAFPADFDVQLTAKIAELETALGRRSGGLQTQRHGSASLEELSRQITDVLRELRALMVKHLRDADPALLAVWKDAARSYAPPVAAETPAPGEQSGGSGI
jgi:hypothetical protein